MPMSPSFVCAIPTLVATGLLVAVCGNSTADVEGHTLTALDNWGFRRERPGTVTEPVQQAKETSVVLQEGKALGLGWRCYVETAMPELQLPNPTGTLRSPRSGA
jgi:hypothetical protein